MPSNYPVDPVKFNEEIKKDLKNNEESKEKESVKTRKVILGDDLGSEKYVSLLSRLDFCNIPYLKEYNVKPFIFGELIFYPPPCGSSINMKDQIRKYTRGGLGFGLSVPLPVNDMLNLHFYNNVAIFNAKSPGDIARASLLEVDIGFF